MAQTRHSNGASIGYLGGSYKQKIKHEEEKGKEEEKNLLCTKVRLSGRR
jgi:hypothetical protein